MLQMLVVIENIYRTGQSAKEQNVTAGEHSDPNLKQLQSLPCD